MNQHDEAVNAEYPHGRGYGHDYMRGGEVFGGYGYSEREEYARPRGELLGDQRSADESQSSDPTANQPTPGTTEPHH